MELGLAHRALEAEHQSVVEHGRMIDAVGVADEGVSEATQIEQAIPVGVVAGEARDLEAEDDADIAQSHLGGEPGKPISGDDAGSRKPEILIDDNDLLGWPTECGCFGSEGILTLCRLATVFDLSGC